MRYWPRPAAWVYVRKRVSWFARTPDLWPRGDAADATWSGRLHSEVLAQYRDMHRRIVRPVPRMDFNIGPDGEIESFGYLDDDAQSPLTTDELVEAAAEAEARSAYVRAAWATVPERVRCVVDRMDERDAWRVLRFIGHVDGALELFETVPWLAFALMHQSLVRERPVQDPYASARRLLRIPDGWERWRRVAGWLGFEPSKAFVRLVRRMPPVNVSAYRYYWMDRPRVLPEFSQLRAVWADPQARKPLLHAPRVDAEVVALVHAAFVAGALRQLHPDLVAVAWAGGARGGVASTYARLVRAWPLLEPGRPVPDMRSAEEVDAHVEALRRRVVEHPTQGGGVFPAPPLPDTEHIRALRDEASLVAEGFTMRHCIGNGTWAARACRFEGYGYAIRVGEERGSLWISRTNEPMLFASYEFRGPANTAPGPAVRAVVDAWLDAHRRDVARRGQEALPREWVTAFQRRATEHLPPALFDLIEADVPF